MFANIPGLRCKDFTYEMSPMDNVDKQVGRSFYVFTSRKCLDAWLQSSQWKMCQKQLPNMTHRFMKVLEGSEHTAELGKWAHAPLRMNLPPTVTDVLNSVIVTSEFKLINIDAAGARQHMKENGCKLWRNVKGLRSKWFWFEESTMTMGGVYTFFDEASVKAYKKTPLFKSMWTTPIIDPKTLVIT